MRQLVLNRFNLGYGYTGTLAKREDPDEMLHKVAYNQEKVKKSSGSGNASEISMTP